MSSKVDELKLDIEEMNELLKQANRQRSKDMLSLEVRRLQTELANLVEQNLQTSGKPATPISNSQKCYEVKINNYCWDQTTGALKLYITLKDVHQLSKEAVVCNFGEKSLDLQVLGLDNKNYSLTINNLCEEIDANNSNIKVKTDMVVVTLVKKVAKNWQYVTEVEKRIKESKASMVPDISEDGDPSANLMNIVKKIYLEGDDEIKRVIAKSWTESHEKQIAGVMPDYS